jgi:vanillin dehydrogenase
MSYKFSMFINGEWKEPGTGQYLQVYNPWNGETHGEVAAASLEDVDDAVMSSVQAQQQWEEFVPSQRERILLKAAEILEEEKEEMIKFIVDESGSAIGKATFEVNFVISSIRAAAGECRRIYGQIIPSETQGMISMAIRSPLGVIAAIGPYNFPFLLLSKKVAFGLAAGNGLVIKSSSETPGIAYKIATLFARAGVPAGLVNAVSGKGSVVGDAMVTHPRIAMVAFTGSTEVGLRIAQLAAEQFKKCTLEMGGKSPLLIFEDADIELAVDAATFGIFNHQGQICMVNSRILVHRDIYPEFLEKFKWKAASLPIGSSGNSHCVIGPLINENQVSIVKGHIDDALSKGASLITGGKHNGLFYEPTILADVTHEMNVYAEETFGPLVSVIPFDTVNEAIEIANDTPYGLSAAVITRNMETAFKVARKLDSGSVHINDSTVYDEPMAPFGGVKSSGMGREGGHYSIEEMTELKWITIPTDKVKFPF